MGLWHDIESYPSGYQEGDCPNALYSLSDDGVDVFNTQVISQNLDTIRGIAVPKSDDGSGKLLVSFPIIGTNCKYQGFKFSFLQFLVGLLKLTLITLVDRFRTIEPGLTNKRDSSSKQILFSTIYHTI